MCVALQVRFFYKHTAVVCTLALWAFAVTPNPAATTKLAMPNKSTCASIYVPYGTTDPCVANTYKGVADAEGEGRALEAKAGVRADNGGSIESTGWKRLQPAHPAQ